MSTLNYLNTVNDNYIYMECIIILKAVHVLLLASSDIVLYELKLFVDTV